MNAQLWIIIAQWVFNVMVAVYLWYQRRYQVTNARVSRLDREFSARMEEMEKDLVCVTGDMKQFPTRAEVNGLRDEIRALSSDLAEVRGRLQGINRAVDLINEFLIQQGGRG